MESDQLPCESKLAFDTEKDAKVQALVLESQRGLKLKPYHCRHCGLWHLSGSSYND